MPLVVRAAESHDLEGLMALALQTGGGMTTLKPDRDKLSARLDIACASFASAIAPAQRDYVFVMEDVSQNRIVGVCAIKAAVGLDDSFYNYRIGTMVHSSKALNVYSRMETLTLGSDLTGSAELCSLYLDPAYRHGDNGRLLSKSRMLFIAQFPHFFPDRLIAELRGFQRNDGTSPFWDSLGQHFFKMGFDRADGLSSQDKKSFIAELMPRYPLYIALLPQEAQDVIGKVHAASAPARRMLEQEGMHFEGYLDIFDAGPVLQARGRELRSVRESMLAQATLQSCLHPHPPNAEQAGFNGAPATATAMLISNTLLSRFRVTAGPAVLVHNPARASLSMVSDQLALLECGQGDTVRCVALQGKFTPSRSGI
jgi:arginine N-succinyltransferase